MRSNFLNKYFELDYKATILIMRWLVVLLVIFMAVYSARGFDFFSANYILAMAIVMLNALVSLFPASYFEKPWFTYLLFILDIGFVSAMIYFSEGINTDFYLVYFISIFMSSIGRSVGGAMPVAAIASIMYGWLIYRQGGMDMLSSPAFWLRMPFFTLVALFTSLWAGRVENERKKKEEAEYFKKRLEEEIDIATNEIKKTMMNYRVLKEYNENILASISSGVLVVDMEGKITTFNREAVNIFRLFSSAVLGKKLEEIPVFGPISEMMRQTMDKGHPQQNRELTVTAENGREIVLSISTSILHNQTTRSNGAIAVFQDVTATKKLEERVKQSEKLALLGEMAAVMAHEIRNPLNSIAGFSQLLQAKKDIDPKIARFVEIIVHEAFRIDAIISDILDYAHRKKIQLATVNMEELLRNLLQSGEIKKDGKRIEICLDVESNLPQVEGDRVRLERAIINLINNSRDAIEDVGRIEVSVRSALVNDVAGIEISVSDDGCGIPSEIQEKIFQPFFTTKSSGTGLGLAIIKRIVEEHRGMLEVKSEPGNGTIFRLFLPDNGRVMSSKMVA